MRVLELPQTVDDPPYLLMWRVDDLMPVVAGLGSWHGVRRVVGACVNGNRRKLQTHECIAAVDRRDFHSYAATTSNRPRLLSAAPRPTARGR